MDRPNWRSISKRCVFPRAFLERHGPRLATQAGVDRPYLTTFLFPFLQFTKHHPGASVFVQKKMATCRYVVIQVRYRLRLRTYLSNGHTSA
jgi:hypothetical protein